MNAFVDDDSAVQRALASADRSDCMGWVRTYLFAKMRKEEKRIGSRDETK